LEVFEVAALAELDFVVLVILALDMIPFIFSEDNEFYYKIKRLIN
jgi:hypothetical protein